MTPVLAAEGGYQEFALRGGSGSSCSAAALTALLALAVGFVLMRGVLAAGRGHAEMQEIAGAIQEGARPTSSASSARSA